MTVALARTKDRIDYADRLNRVTAYIYDHLDDDIDLDRLAEVACLSPSHWHRIYHALHGETLATTVRRLRLHRAAGFLAHSSMTLESIALKSGYSSVQAFSRAFSADYDMPPAQYRTTGAHAAFRAARAQTASVAYDVEIRHVAALPAVAVDHVGSYMQIGKAFDPLFGWCAMRGLLGPSTRTFGIYYDDPTWCEENELRSRACITSPATVAVEPPVLQAEVPGGTCAVLRYRGPYATMRDAYLWLYGQWLTEAGEEPADGPVFEEYLNNPRDTAPNDLLTDIYLPLAGYA
ncbi:GyrI-like domain-containing protein [Bradyrhizobium sp. U87765 SZCCT0131]|uniref:AraC family transcriptional regulator n=1 Tax=unclassified Bradyrhizobium TaxID=2631580 RepID=UPI001BA6FA8B|nr:MULTISPECIES: GyrI-like domain-containing protein [unclassified Bradyrhizobium]MBR1220378.1 GyrI-like domain-containing protein [Bradyrhizobium sp. U87765 SZCCT0131]MBR1263167.1 GyrI-like domain-containing protein [Bradyrhizobium sp. U87765 SZCCT0134]MBR1306950.1 GyrI-like domain-containing protein [Bradyrhizobium sp. U87765 SZCCT0110]MBR1323449.1 GyrI-like domain-containing protein [Bradyrhizobium sp. U87765 SZCCT0109]MBR1345904.1 GyrI-like domain-containing protein [Bradyrhizobium sp. U87